MNNLEKFKSYEVSDLKDVMGGKDDCHEDITLYCSGGSSSGTVSTDGPSIAAAGGNIAMCSQFYPGTTTAGGPEQ